MKVLVTGGAGFIGSNLVDRLVESGHDVTVLDNLSTGNIVNLDKVKKKINFLNVDITKKKLDNYFENIDQVFHLAGLADIAPSIKNPKSYFDVNLFGTLNVLEASKNKQVKKFIYAASASCYGIPKDYPTSEKSKIDPKYPYALTKYLAEKVVIHWAKVYKMQNISLRFFNAYGPRSRTTGAYGAVLDVFLAQKLANKPLTIVGDGNQTRDFIYVSDLVEAIILAAERGKNSQIYNIGGGKEISINSIANMISSNKVYVPKRPGEPDRSLADISKIKFELNWEPKIAIEDGVKILIKNIDQWKNAPVWTPDSIDKATKEWFNLLS